MKHEAWGKVVANNKTTAEHAAVEERVIEMKRQQSFNPGDIVEWSPLATRGLWLVTHTSDYDDLGRVSTRHDRNTKGVVRSKYRVRHPTNIPVGKLRLKWFSGWGGYANDRMPVTVKSKEVRKLAEMEVIALASSSGARSALPITERQGYNRA